MTTKETIENLKGKSLIDNNPELCTEWDYEKNGKLLPEMVSKGSNKKVWWKCEKGHEWQAVISSRNGGRGCPYCSNRKVLQGFNDLATNRPDLAKEWNYEKNGTLMPQMVATNSDKNVWWKGKCGHAWHTAIYNRTMGKGCPYCSRRKKIENATK